jgi:hypothetical protein
VSQSKAPATAIGALGFDYSAPTAVHKSYEQSGDELDDALAAIEALRIAAAMLPRTNQRRRIRLSVTDAERDRLSEAAHKHGLNSQQLVHDALLAYLKEVGREYRSVCHCLDAEQS